MRNPHIKIICWSVAAALLMFGFSFAFSPLYSKLCTYTDFYSGIRILSTKTPDIHRTIKIEFVTNNNQNLLWDFYPRTANVNVHPNENIKVIFFAKNNTTKKMTAQAIPSFSPAIAAKHFHKTECFCFNQQTLDPGASIDMPLIFHVDEDLPQNIPIISLAYTLFDVTQKTARRTMP